LWNRNMANLSKNSSRIIRILNKNNIYFPIKIFPSLWVEKWQNLLKKKIKDLFDQKKNLTILVTTKMLKIKILKKTHFLTV
jgi:hypothetical protein